MTNKPIAIRLLTLSAILLSTTAQAQNPDATRQRLERATASSSLQDLTSKPWHAKLEITLFDAKSKNPVNGTIEYSKNGDDWLRVITVGANTETTLFHDKQTYRGGTNVPDAAVVLLNTFLHPGPRPSDIDGTTPETRKQSFGKVSLDCVMLSRPIKQVAVIPLGLFPTYCLALGSDTLRASYDFGSRTVLLNRSGRFLDHDVAIELSIMDGSVVAGTAKVTSLSTFTPAPETFLPTAQLAPVAVPLARLASGVISGMKIGGPPPVYPDEAKAGHISGTVTLHAIIGRDGHIHTLRVISAPDPSLAISALAAVRQWTYKPYLLNGEPTEVDTTIIVNYNLNY